MILVEEDKENFVSNVWRISGSESGDYEVTYTLLFVIDPVLTNTVELLVFDKFALVHYDDQSLLLIIRPDVIGTVAKYATSEE